VRSIDEATLFELNQIPAHTRGRSSHRRGEFFDTSFPLLQ